MHYEKFADGTVKCIEEEIPFELPEGWEWVRLQSICEPITDGTHKTPQYSENGYVFLSSKNVTSGKIDWDNIMYIPEDLHNELYSRLSPQKNDILLAKNGTTGVAAIVDRDCVFDIYVSLALLRIVKYVISPEYLLSVIASSTIQDYFNSSLKGIGVPNLHLEHIRTSLIPVSPLHEQHLIVEKLNELLSFVDTIESDKTDLQTIIQQTKSKILDLAIRGKLVPHDPNDEPASVLLERIRTEKEELIKQGKIKRDKRESVIFKGEDNSYYEKIGSEVRCIDEELPFEVSDSWAFARLKHIGEVVGGGTPKTTVSEYWNGEIPWLTPADFSGYEDMYISAGSRTITEIGLQSSSAQMLPTNSILYSSRAPIGYIAINSNPVSTNQGFKSLVPFDIAMTQYLYYCLKARTDDIVRRATGTTFKEISGTEMAETIIPLPPINEQKRIFEQASQMLKIITKIEKSLS